jgi:hypothetical protein
MARAPLRLQAIEQAFRREILDRTDTLPKAVADIEDIRRLFLDVDVLKTRQEQLRPGEVVPTQLLVPDFGVVPFHGREQELADLLAWCQEDSAAVSARLYWGGGGQGKTRLMIEATERLRLQPCDPRWRAGFLDTSGTALHADHIHRLIDRSHSLLVILDYAETRAERVRDLIERAWELREGKRIRIVLLARAPGDWWRELRGGGGQASRLLRALTFPEVELKSLSSTLPERGAIFDQALAAFQRAIPQKERAPAPASIPDLSKEHFSNVLLVHMAANAAARGKTLESEDALFDEMLAHESN